MSNKDFVGIFLASSGSRGDHLLFRYPYETEEQYSPSISRPVVRKNPYAVHITEDYQVPKCTRGSSIVNGVLVGYSDKILASLLAVKANLCGSKFEVKVDDVVFVGHPMLLHPVHQGAPCCKRENQSMISFNLVLALRDILDTEVLSCYHALTKQLAIALRHEERRCGLLSKQKNIMTAIQDDMAAMPEDSIEPPYRMILQKCHLAQQLRQIYEDVCSTGVVQIYINKWVHINWCLPQKVHRVHMKQMHPPPANSFINGTVQPESTYHRCLIDALRPYHGILLLINGDVLLESLPIDASPALTRLVRVTNPFKNLQKLASDADLSLTQVYQLVTHLVYWSKATIIYPLCEANVYVLSPNISTFVNSSLVEKFVDSFPNVSLAAVLSDFSVPSPLGDHKDVLGLPQQQAQEVQMVTWLLQHRLLVQLHTYVFLTSSHGQQGAGPKRKPSLVSPTSDEAPIFRKASSNSDINSINSDETLSIKSPSLELLSDITEDSARGAIYLTEQAVLSLRAAEKHIKDKYTFTENHDDFKMLMRLWRYFDGKHHLEEIMYNENILRSQLLMILDKYRDILVTCQHEDPGLSGRISSTINGV